MGKKSKEKKTRQSGGYQQVRRLQPQGQFPSSLRVFIMGGVLLSLFTPLLVSNGSFFPFVGAKSMYFMGFVEVVFFAWLALISFRPEYRPRKNALLVASALLLISMTVSTVLGADPSRSFWSKHERVTGLLMWLHLFGLFLVASSTFRKTDWLLIFGASNFFGVWAALEALFMLNPASKGGGTLGNESFLGVYLLFNAFIAIYLFFFKFEKNDMASAGLKRFLKIFSAFSFAVFFFSLLFVGTQSWTNFIEHKETVASYGQGISLAGDPIAKSYTVEQAGKRFPSGLQLNAAEAVSSTVNNMPADLSGGIITVAPGSSAGSMGYHSYEIAATLSGGTTSSAKISYYVSKPLFQDVMENGARADKYCLFGGMFLLGLLYLAFESKKWKAFGRLALSASVLGVVVLFLLAIQPGNIIYEKFSELATKARFLIWQSAWESFLDKPLFGWGPENFDISFPLHFDPRLYLSEYGGEIWFDRAHNIIMDNLVALGIVGSVLYLSVFAAAFYVLIRLYFSKKIDFISAAVPITAFIAYFLQNLTVFDMVSSLMILFLFFGFIAGTEREIKEAEEKKDVSDSPQFVVSPTISVPVVLVAFFFCLLNFVWLPARNGVLAVEAVDYTLKTDARIEAYKETLAVSPIGKYQIREFFAESFEGFFTDSRSVTVSKTQLAKEFDYLSGELKKSIDSSPLDFRGYLKLGQMYNYWAKMDPSKAQDAADYLEKAVKLSPRNQQAYWSLSEAKFYQKKFDEAIGFAEKSIELEPGLERSHIIAMSVAASSDNWELFEKKKAEALEINPAWEKDIIGIFGLSGD